jgi:aldose 1-epimerase
LSVRREPWGATRAGEPVELFTLERGRLRARVATFGATLVSLDVFVGAGRRTHAVLGLDSLAGYESPSNPYLGGVIGRCANRIAGARFSLDGREHALSANEGRHHLHGGARGFDRRVWRVTAASGEALELAYASRDGEEGYPGAVEALASYALTPDALVGRLAATAAAATPLNLTQHSYFNLAGRGTILDHELELRASRYVAVDGELIPTGELLAVAGGPYDFRAPRRVGERLAELAGSPARGYDVCYALDRDGAGHAARLRDPASGLVLELSTNQPGLQLYSGQHLRPLDGERGRGLAPFAGLCLEAQGFPDAVHQAAFPPQILRPGERYENVTTWRFAVQP